MTGKKKKVKRPKPISLYPLSLEEALEATLQTPPPGDKRKKKKSKKNKK
jgi:hypothetical protein